MQSQWKQNLGLTVPLKNMEWKTFLDYRAKLEYKGVARTGWVGDYMDPYTFLDLFSTKTGDNGTGWSPPEFVAAIHAANREQDPQKRYELLAKAEKMLLDAQPVIPLATSSTNWMKKPYVKGHVSESGDAARLEVRVHRARSRQVVRFIVRRLIVILPMVLVVVSVTWGLIRLAPGNFYTGEKPLPPAIEKNIRERYGLDKPWYVQYGKTISSTLRGDFGLSLRYQGQPVNTILRQAVPVSVALGLTAYLLALAVGIVAGTYAALHQNTRIDYVSMAIAMLGISIPNFVLGPTLVLLFGLTWYVLPPARWEGFGVHMILPVLTLSAVYMAYIARLTRSGMLEVLRSNYIRTARAKGLPERQILWRHAMRGGLLPVVSFSGPALALSADRHRRRRAHLRAAGARQLLHQREPEPRRAAHHRHRRVHFDRGADFQSDGGHCVRIHRSESEVLADLKDQSDYEI